MTGLQTKFRDNSSSRYIDLKCSPLWLGGVTRLLSSFDVATFNFNPSIYIYDEPWGIFQAGDWSVCTRLSDNTMQLAKRGHVIDNHISSIFPWKVLIHLKDFKVLEVNGWLIKHLLMYSMSVLEIKELVTSANQSNAHANK